MLDPEPGGWGGNELKIEDLKGGEEVYLHAQKDEVIEVEKEKEQRVRGGEKLLVEKDRTIEVKGNQQLSVAKDDSTAIGVNQTLAVTGNRATQVLGSQTETVGVAETVKVAKTRQVTVAAASAQTVGGAAALTIGAGYAVNVVGAQNTAVGGALTREVGGARVEVVGAAREERVAGDSSAKVGGDFASEVKGLVNMSTEGSQQEVVTGSQQTEVTGTVRQSGREIRIEAPRITVVVGGRRVITLDQSGLVELHGTSITVNGSSIALKGAKIEKRAPAAARRQQVEEQKLKELYTAPDKAELTLVDLDAAPIVNQPFRIELEGGTQRKGVTDKDGHALMPVPKAGRFQVTFEGEPPTGWTPKLGGKAQGAFRVELGKAYSLTTGKNHLLDLAVKRNTMTGVYLFDGRANDEYPKYVLESEDGEYRQERGPKDDLLLGDKYLQLQFDGLLGGKTYKLTRWNDAKESRVIFEGAEYGRIIDQGRPATTETVEIDHGSPVKK